MSNAPGWLWSGDRSRCQASALANKLRLSGQARAIEVTGGGARKSSATRGEHRARTAQKAIRGDAAGLSVGAVAMGADGRWGAQGGTGSQMLLTLSLTVLKIFSSLRSACAYGQK